MGFRNAIADALDIKTIPDLLPKHEEDGFISLNINGRIQIHDYTCGAVAGFIVLKYFHRTRSIHRFFDRVGADERYGTNTTNLIKALRLSGLSVNYKRDIDYEYVLKSIENNKPVIVCIKTSDRYVWHWVVIYGARKNGRSILLANNSFLPTIGDYRYFWSEFKRIWAEPGVGLICSKKKKKLHTK